MNNLPMTPSLALLRSAATRYRPIVASIHHPSLECPLVVPEVKHSRFFTLICAIGQVALRGARSVVSAATQPWSRHTHQH